MRLSICLILLILGASLNAQPLADTTLPQLGLQQLYDWMQLSHPVVRQAQLQVDMAGQGVRQAKGAFDPKLLGTLDQKMFDEKEYYSYLEGGLSMATRSGIGIKGGYTQNQGLFLNPEDNLPQGGLWSLGVVVPLGQGLFIDGRRAGLQQAQQYQLMSEVERRYMLNELLLEASLAWLQWQLAYGNLQVWDEAVQLAQNRMLAIRESYRAGNLASIDTLEASLNFQDRMVGRQDALLDFQQAALALGNHLWVEDVPQPQLALSLRPEALDAQSLPEFSAIFAVDQHPALQQLDYEAEIMEIERRWKAEQLKPRLDVQYNVLQQAVGTPAEQPVLNPNNYKLGVDFAFPILLRKERAALAQTRIKQEMIVQKQDQKRLELQNKRGQYLQQMEIYTSQRTIYRQMAQQYAQLLDAERRRFIAGESALFLINSRELKLIDARLKLLKAENMVLKSRLGLLWAEGRLPEVF